VSLTKSNKDNLVIESISIIEPFKYIVNLTKWHLPCQLSGNITLKEFLREQINPSLKKS